MNEEQARSNQLSVNKEASPGSFLWIQTFAQMFYFFLSSSIVIGVPVVFGDMNTLGGFGSMVSIPALMVVLFFVVYRPIRYISRADSRAELWKRLIHSMLLSVGVGLVLFFLLGENWREAQGAL